MEEITHPSFSPDNSLLPINSHYDLLFLQKHLLETKKTALVFCNVSKAHTLEYADILTAYFNISKTKCTDALKLDSCYEFMHPHDAQHIRKLHNFAREFLNNCTPTARFNYKLIVHCRMHGSDQQYHTYIHEIMVSANNSQGDIAKLCIKIMPFTLTNDNDYAYGYLLNIAKKHVIPPPYAPQNKPYALITAKEYNIITLLAQHYTHLEVANELQISFSTMRNHCTNIMNKTQMRTMPKVLDYLGFIGLL